MTRFLTGSLLVATPQITEPVFRRSVVCVLHHDEDGAHGVVLNKPLGIAVDKVLTAWSRPVTQPWQLFQGGPVGMDTALGIAWMPGTAESAHPAGHVGDADGSARGGGGAAGAAPIAQPLFGALAVVDLDADPERVRAEVSGMRVFAGYSGWGPGQLEAEVSEHGWYVVDHEPGDLVTTDVSGLWRAVLRRQRGRLALVSTFPDEPEWN